MPHPPIKGQDSLSQGESLGIQLSLQELGKSIKDEFASIKKQQVQILSQLSEVLTNSRYEPRPPKHQQSIETTLESLIAPNSVSSLNGSTQSPENKNMHLKSPLASRKSLTTNSIVSKSRVSGCSRASNQYGSRQSNGGTSDRMKLQSEGEISGSRITLDARCAAAEAAANGISKKSKLQFGVAQSFDDDNEWNWRKFFVWRRFQRFVAKGDKFELIVATLILANSVVLCCEVQYQGFDVCYDFKFPDCREKSDDVWPNAKSVFLVIDWIFGVVFVMEMVIKIVCLGVEYFKQGWNHLDALCVVAFLVDKIASAILPIDSQTIRLLRLCRLVRLIRLMRYLESLDVLYVMTTAIAGMSKIVAWAVALLSLMLMTSALFLTQVLHTYYFDTTDVNTLTTQELDRYHEVYEYFGSFTRCLLSMFELTLANWPPVTRLLSEEVSEWFMLVCVIHKLTIGFAVIGVLNGVILQETFKVAATDDLVMLRQKQRAARLMRSKMQNLFDALDISGDGQLDFGEFLIIAANREVNTWLASMDIETDDLSTLFKLLDVDKSGTISVDELLLRMPRIKGAARGIDMMALTQALLVDPRDRSSERLVGSEQFVTTDHLDVFKSSSSHAEAFALEPCDT